MNTKKKKKILENNIKEFNKLYEETYNETANYVITKVDRIEYIDEILIKVYKRIYSVLTEKGIDYIYNARKYALETTKEVMFEYYNEETPNNAKFIIVPDINIEILDVENYNNSIIESMSEQEILNAINKLDLLLQKSIILYYAQNLTIKEIALLLKCQENDVKYMISKAIKLIEKHTEKIEGEQSGKTKTNNTNKFHK